MLNYSKIDRVKAVQFALTEDCFKDLQKLGINQVLCDFDRTDDDGKFLYRLKYAQGSWCLDVRVGDYVYVKEKEYSVNVMRVDVFESLYTLAL